MILSHIQTYLISEIEYDKVIGGPERQQPAGWPQGQGRQVGARNVTSDNRWQLEVDKGINRELSMRRRSFARSDSKLRDIFIFLLLRRLRR